MDDELKHWLAELDAVRRLLEERIAHSRGRGVMALAEEQMAVAVLRLLEVVAEIAKTVVPEGK